MKLVEIPSALDAGRLAHGFFDDFDHYVDADRWTLVATDSGTAAVGDAAGGVITLTASDGTVADNDEVYLHSTNELFLFASGAPLFVEARLNFTEANTDDANMMFGVANAVAANHLVDDGAGPLASYSGAVFYKVDGQTYWTVENSDSTTQKTTALDGSHESVIGSPFAASAQTAGGGYQTLRIEWIPKSSTKADVLFWIDGAPVAKHTDQAYANATEMAVVFGVKNGGENNESMLVDYVGAYQYRV